MDLAWKVAPPKEQGTGHCIIDGHGRVTEIGLLTTDEEIIELATAEDSWIGIDASLKVPVDRTIRNCERELRSLGLRVLPTSRAFYQRHYGGCRGEALAQKLEELGLRVLRHGPRRSSRSTPIRWRGLFSLPPCGTRKVLGTSGGRAPRPF